MTHVAILGGGGGGWDSASILAETLVIRISSAMMLLGPRTILVLIRFYAARQGTGQQGKAAGKPTSRVPRSPERPG